jgi:ethanolamine ammonia-lyase small subunit
MPPMTELARADPWAALRRLTAARIALGRSGASLPTRALLEFGLAQAQARDAVHAPARFEELEAGLQAAGCHTLTVHSAAADRTQFLLRPDLGRRLDGASAARLDALALPTAPDLVLVLADGLSALALQRHALALWRALQPGLAGWTLGPVVLAQQARVALGDEIGARLGARQVVVWIGERPGLSACDSLGIYLTHAPRVGRTDAERNCISNVRPAGLAYEAAAARLLYLLRGALRLGRSGIALKDDHLPAALAPPAGG